MNKERPDPRKVLFVTNSGADSFVSHAFEAVKERAIDAGFHVTVVDISHTIDFDGQEIKAAFRDEYFCNLNRKICISAASGIFGENEWPALPETTLELAQEEPLFRKHRASAASKGDKKRNKKDRWR